jgi:hypothetical protein
MNCNEEFLKTGPCSISYKREHIGVTLDSPLLNFEPEFYEARCNQTGCANVRKIVTNMKITISVSLKQINRNFARFHIVRGKKVNVAFGDDVLVTGGILRFSPLSTGGGIAYCFPRTVLIPESAYAYQDPEDYYLKIKFDIYEDSEGVLIEKHSM